MYISLKAWPVVTINSRLLLRLFWGPRRLSSKADQSVALYAGEVSAHWRLWLSWFRQNFLRHFFGPVYVVITKDPESGHGPKYRARLIAEEQARLRREKVAETLRRADEIQEARAAARARKDFALADALRAELEAAGIQVNDNKLARTQ